MVEFHSNLIYTVSPVGIGINPQLAICAFWQRAMGAGTDRGGGLFEHGVPSGISELDRVGLTDFTGRIVTLSEAWFGEGELTPALSEMGDYILTSGAHGIEKRAVLNAVCFSKRGTGVAALAERAFYPRAELESCFHWSKGRPWRLPAVWCTRAVKAVT